VGGSLRNGVRELLSLKQFGLEDAIWMDMDDKLHGLCLVQCNLQLMVELTREKGSTNETECLVDLKKGKFVDVNCVRDGEKMRERGWYKYVQRDTKVSWSVCYLHAGECSVICLPQKDIQLRQVLYLPTCWRLF